MSYHDRDLGVFFVLDGAPPEAIVYIECMFDEYTDLQIEDAARAAAKLKIAKRRFYVKRITLPIELFFILIIFGKNEMMGRYRTYKEERDELFLEKKKW